jgi:site-specific recombinase XerC
MSKQPKAPPSFAALVQAYFAEYLTQQRALSPQTIATYRDGFVLFLGFAESRLGKSPAAMAMADITPELIMAFLDHLERQRHNSVRSRNARLAALRSFLKFAAHRDVSSLQVIERALGVPVKRFERPMFGYLSREEMLAVIGTPDGTWIGQRDHVLFLLLYNTGARVSEITGVKVGEAVLDDSAACVHLHGQGPQAAQRAAVAFDRQGDPGLVEAESAVRGGIAIAAKSQRTRDDAKQCSPKTRIGGGDRNRDQPRLGKATDLATYDPSHHGNASVAGRRRYQRDRALARA